MNVIHSFYVPVIDDPYSILDSFQVYYFSSVNEKKKQNNELCVYFFK